MVVHGLDMNYLGVTSVWTNDRGLSLPFLASDP